MIDEDNTKPASNFNVTLVELLARRIGVQGVPK